MSTTTPRTARRPLISEDFPVPPPLEVQPVAPGVSYVRVNSTLPNPVAYTTLQCCGVKEIANVYQLRNKKVNPKGVIDSVYKLFIEQPGRISGTGFILFTQAQMYEGTPDGYGDRLADFIEKKHLGSLTITEERRNPNSGNFVKVYLWGVDHEAVTKLCS